MSWQKLSTKTTYQNRYMTVTEEEVITDHGDQVTFGIVHKGPGVSIVAKQDDYYYLIRQYRYPVNYTGWEFPAGHVEGTSIEEAARLELEEEAGVVAGKLTKLGKYFEAPGHLEQTIHIYLASDLKTGKQHLEPSEKGIRVRRFTLPEINQLVRDGEIKDGLTLVALKYLELHLVSQA